MGSDARKPHANGCARTGGATAAGVDGMPDPAMAIRHWIVPEVVIDPLLRNESAETDQRVSGGKGVTQVQPPPSLPSLKASGLLDVVPPPDEAGPSAGRSSPWSTNPPSVSPRVPLRSPALLPHTHLGPNPSSVSPGSPMPSSSTSRSLNPISSQDLSRGERGP